MKVTSTGLIAKSNGFYCQHAKESLLLGVNRGDERRMPALYFKVKGWMNAKPRAIARDLRKTFQATRCYEMFGRRNNLAEGWVTFGDQLPEAEIELDGVYINRNDIEDRFKVKG